MVARRVALIVGLLACGVSAVGVVIPFAGVVGAVIAAVALVYEHRAAGAVIIPFAIDDWRSDGRGSLVLEISRRRHGRRSPTASVWLPDGDGWEQVICDVGVRADGSVSIGIGESGGAIAGQVRIV